MPFTNLIGSSVTATSLGALVLADFWIAFSQYSLLFSPVVPLLLLLIAYGSAVTVNLLITEKQGGRSSATHSRITRRRPWSSG